MKCAFVGIGAQKTASTWIHKILEDHPSVVSSDPKELDYFSFYFDKGEDWYHSHFSISDDHGKVFGEISPSYFNDTSVPRRVREYNPDIKIIVTLRDPVERAYSNHLHLIRIGKYELEDFDFKVGLKKYPIYVERSKYYKYLSEWFKNFPRENFLILFQEEIKENPEKTVRNVYQFLNIDSEFLPESLHKKANESFTPKYPAVSNLLKFFASFFSKLGLTSVVTSVKENSFVDSLRQKNKLHLSEVVPKMELSTKETLMDELSEDVLDLAKLLEKENLPWPSFVYAKNKSKG